MKKEIKGIEVAIDCNVSEESFNSIERLTECIRSYRIELQKMNKELRKAQRLSAQIVMPMNRNEVQHGK